MVGQASAGVPGELPVPVTGQAGVAQPQAAVLALQHAIAIQIGQAVSGREGGDYAVLDARQSAAGLRPLISSGPPQASFNSSKDPLEQVSLFLRGDIRMYS